MLRKCKRYAPFTEQEDVNPMNYISNLSDVMLVLAVGMMLALVVAWKVDIVNQSPASVAESAEMAQSASQAYLTDEGETPLEESDLREYGIAYVDENGNYYVVEAETGGASQ